MIFPTYADTWVFDGTCTTTSTTDPWGQHGRIYIYSTSSIKWIELKVVVPKWWRWYDIFRTWVKPKQLRLLTGVRRAILRVQERYPIRQHWAQKRRMYIQKLRERTL